MYKATIDATGKIVGFYHPDVHATIPADALPVPDKVRDRHLSGIPQRWDGQTWQDAPPPTPDPAAIAHAELRQSDADLARVLEDVIAVLGIENSLPQAARDKLARRRALRQKLV